jgi:hypothetical protein
MQCAATGRALQIEPDALEIAFRRMRGKGTSVMFDNNAAPHFRAAARAVEKA